MCSTRPIVPKNFKGTAFSQNALIVLKLKSAPEKKIGKIVTDTFKHKMFFFCIYSHQKVQLIRVERQNSDIMCFLRIQKEAQQLGFESVLSP